MLEVVGGVDSSVCLLKSTEESFRGSCGGPIVPAATDDCRPEFFMANSSKLSPSAEVSADSQFIVDDNLELFAPFSKSRLTSV